ncbi:putative calcium-binding protein CML13 [Symbiodinium microadriaticum]|uniref:Putative calcium-binding protein CML13 n=1 Tax=Symbiodinium microadriaticum TaxID=2951 RepID=A0A1Q9EPD4_SYMMI|nr:putative calcium-binding protein CML13 [Symbiodinium microadriaticum]
MAPSRFPSLGEETPLDDAIAILKRRQVQYSSAPILPPATKPEVEAECGVTTSSWASKSTAASITRSPGSKTPTFKPSPAKLLPPAALKLPRPRRAPAVKKPPQAMQMSKSTSALPQLAPKESKSREPVKAKVVGRPSSRGQVVSRAAAAAFWGIILEDEDGDWGDDEDNASTYGESKKPRPRDLPLSALHAATSVPFEDLKEACGIFEQFSTRDSEDLTEAWINNHNFQKLLCYVCNVESVNQLSEQWVSQAFATADRDRSGKIDIWEFVIWLLVSDMTHCVSASMAQPVAGNVARKHGLSLLNIERYKKSFDRYDLNNNGVIEFNEFKHIITDLLKVPPGLDLPHERLMSMWRSADKDGSGSIDFDEFVAFYMKYFGDTFETEFDPAPFYEDPRLFLLSFA